MGTAVIPAPAAPPTRSAEAPTRPAPHSAASSRLLRRAGVHVLVFGAFAVPAVVLWWHAWDGHLSSTLTCACGDAGQTVWFVAWPAYALAHGLDPFFSGAVQAPYGANLLANASTVPVGILLAPVTLTAGPVVATTLALTLCPALSGWAAWVACRSLVGWPPAAVVAGALFGYSPFVVTNLALGHLGLALLVAPPLLLVAARHVLFGLPGRRTRWGAALGALCGLQLLISGEILAIVVVVGVPCAVLAAIVGRRSLGPPRELLAACGAAAAVGALVVALPAWFFLAGPQHVRGPFWTPQGNTLRTFWDPGAYRGGANVLQRLGGYEGLAGPASSYLGLPLLALACAALAVAWRRRTAWLLAGGAVAGAVCSLGTVLWVTPGHASSAWLPWRLVASWPLLDDVVPQRFSAVVDLCVALLVGVGLGAARAAVLEARRAGVWRAGAAPVSLVLSAAAVVSVWWTYQVPFATRTVAPPPWYADAAPRLPAGSVVLSYPFPFPLDGSSAPMVWQALDGMGFRLAGGYLKEPGPGGRPLSHRPMRQPYGVLAGLTSRAGGPLPSIDPRSVSAVRRALVRWHVADVVVVPRGRDPALAVRLLERVTGRPPLRELGAWVWRIGAPQHTAASARGPARPPRVAPAPPAAPG